MSDNADVVKRGIALLDSQDAGQPQWMTDGEWLMIIDNRTAAELSRTASHDDSGSTPIRTIRPGMNVARITGSTFSFSTQYWGGARCFTLSVSNPVWGKKKINIHDQGADARSVWKSMDDGNDKNTQYGSRAFLERHGKYHIWGFVLSRAAPQGTDPARLDTWSTIEREVRDRSITEFSANQVYVINHTGKKLQGADFHVPAGNFPFHRLELHSNREIMRSEFSASGRFEGDGCAYMLALERTSSGGAKIAVAETGSDPRQHWQTLHDDSDKLCPRGSRAYVRKVACSTRTTDGLSMREVTVMVWVFELAPAGT